MSKIPSGAYDPAQKWVGQRVVIRHHRNPGDPVVFVGVVESVEEDGTIVQRHGEDGDQSTTWELGSYASIRPVGDDA
jgi:ferredoxin-fold anticodon binding domain-containing protein